MHDELGEEGIDSELEPRSPMPAADESRVRLPAAGPSLETEPEPPAHEPMAAYDRPLAELGLLQLTERLGASLVKRKARHADIAPGTKSKPAAPPAWPETFEEVRAEDAARAIADFFGPARSGNAAPEPAMKNPFMRQQEFVRMAAPENDPGKLEPAAALRSPGPKPTMQQAAGLAANLAEDPRNPAFPAAIHGPFRDPGKAERNLRAALATLQRMSGSA